MLFRSIEPSSSASTGDGEEVKAGVPGNVLRIEATEGSEVAEGDVLLVLEAMKMQNEIPAMAAGTVKAINVAAGQNVKVAETLVVIG